MTDQLTDKRPNRPRVKWLTGALGWIAGLVFAALFGSAMLALSSASHAGWLIGNSEKHEGVWALLLIVAALVWWAIWGILRITVFSKGVNWLNRQTGDRAGVVLAFLWMWTIPPAYYFGMDYAFPARLGTKDGYVRIRSSGELMLPGEVVPTTRFERSSKVVPTTVQTATVSFDSLSRNGFTTRITAQAEYRVRVGENLRQVLFRRYADIPLNGDPEYSVTADEVARVLQPVMDEMLGTLTAQPTNGAPAELTIRSRVAAEASIPTLPPWLEYIRVSDIRVESWKKE